MCLETVYNCGSVNKVLKQSLGQILVNELSNLKIKKAALEVVQNFDYDIVLDYLELSGSPWFSRSYNHPIRRLPTVDEIKEFLSYEINQIIKDRAIVEKHLWNNFIIFYNGDHFTLTYSIATIISG